VPDHYKAEAAVILVARQQAAMELLNKIVGGGGRGGTPVAPALDMETLLGEF
jgi:hypothetical protein